MKRFWTIGSACVVIVGGCDAALLPPDYGPSSVVGGRIDPTSGPETETTPTTNPTWSLQWLDGRTTQAPATAALIGQHVITRRSESLDRDVDFQIASPVDQAQFEPTDHQGVRVAVGKMVGFDDLGSDRKLDWACTGSPCDRVRSTSSEFVVFVDTPPTCVKVGALGAENSVVRISRGHHYFRLQLTTMGLQLLEHPESAGFTLSWFDRAPSESNPTWELREFAQRLFDSWKNPRC